MERFSQRTGHSGVESRRCPQATCPTASLHLREGQRKQGLTPPLKCHGHPCHCMSVPSPHRPPPAFLSTRTHSSSRTCYGDWKLPANSRQRGTGWEWGVWVSGEVGWDASEGTHLEQPVKRQKLAKGRGPSHSSVSESWTVSYKVKQAPSRPAPPCAPKTKDSACPHKGLHTRACSAFVCDPQACPTAGGS